MNNVIREKWDLQAFEQVSRYAYCNDNKTFEELSQEYMNLMKEIANVRLNLMYKGDFNGLGDLLTFDFSCQYLLQEQLHNDYFYACKEFVKAVGMYKLDSMNSKLWQDKSMFEKRDQMRKERENPDLSFYDVYPDLNKQVESYFDHFVKDTLLNTIESIIDFRLKKLFYKHYLSNMNDSEVIWYIYRDAYMYKLNEYDDIPEYVRKHYQNLYT